MVLTGDLSAAVFQSPVVFRPAAFFQSPAAFLYLVSAAVSVVVPSDVAPADIVFLIRKFFLSVEVFPVHAVFPAAEIFPTHAVFPTAEIFPTHAVSPTVEVSRSPAVSRSAEHCLSLSVSRSAGSFLSYTAFLPAAFFPTRTALSYLPALVFLPVSGCWPGEWFLPFSELPLLVSLPVFPSVSGTQDGSPASPAVHFPPVPPVYQFLHTHLYFRKIVETVLPSGSNLLSGNLFPAGVLFLSVFGIQSAILLSVPADEFPTLSAFLSLTVVLLPAVPNSLTALLFPTVSGSPTTVSLLSAAVFLTAVYLFWAPVLLPDFPSLTAVFSRSVSDSLTAVPALPVSSSLTAVPSLSVSLSLRSVLLPRRVLSEAFSPLPSVFLSVSPSLFGAGQYFF